ncbi:hypothetical protein [Massilia aurea]|uniref:hypothetical protein n=1 Tax=Massilia aurea TaxID=373040 RepID=UPI001E604231|nr:hypothetical protein [Massilia aurea]
MSVEQVLDSAVNTVVARVDYEIHISNASKLNLADFQNAVPLLRELAIANQSDRELLQLQVRLESFPPFVKPKTWSIDACDAISRYHIKDCDVALDGILLARLTEAETSTITVSLLEFAGTDKERVLATEERKIELLPRNQWGGLAHLPDLVAAFVQPNELAVDRLLKRTAQVLREAGKNSALDAIKVVQSGPGSLPLHCGPQWRDLVLITHCHLRASNTGDKRCAALRRYSMPVSAPAWTSRCCFARPSSRRA